MTDDDSPGRDEVTRLLLQLGEGDRSAADQLLPLVYAELRRLARRQLGPAAAGLTLNPTALVHEAYVKLVDRTKVSWEDRHHFFGVFSVAMRRIVIDHARAAKAQKRGGDQVAVTLQTHSASVEQPVEQLIALDEALGQLAAQEPRLARVVECRYFAGLSEVETAQALGVTDRTVRRDWVKARGLLRALLDEDLPPSLRAGS